MLSLKVGNSFLRIKRKVLCKRSIHPKMYISVFGRFWRFKTSRISQLCTLAPQKWEKVPWMPVPPLGPRSQENVVDLLLFTSCGQCMSGHSLSPFPWGLCARHTLHTSMIGHWCMGWLGTPSAPSAQAYESRSLCMSHTPTEALPLSLPVNQDQLGLVFPAGCYCSPALRRPPDVMNFYAMVFL